MLKSKIFATFVDMKVCESIFSLLLPLLKYPVTPGPVNLSINWIKTRGGGGVKKEEPRHSLLRS